MTSSGEESFCSSSDDQAPPSTTNNASTPSCSFLAPLPPLPPSCHSRCPPSVVNGQSFSPLSTFAAYPFPVIPPASTPGLVPPASPGAYRFALGGQSRGRLQRQNAIKSSSSSSSKLASPSRTRSHAGL